MSTQLNRLWLRRFSYIGLFGITIITIKNFTYKYIDIIDENDEFSIYTNEQQKKYFFSGMHEPFITKDKQQLDLFKKYFSQYQFLIQENLYEVIEKHSLKTPVKIKSLSEYENEKIDIINTDTLIVGGPPALITAAQLIQNEKNLIYLNDFRRIPIANGSAWFLEEDAQTEAPSNDKPTKFVFDQIKRILLMNVSLKNIQETGEFPWGTIDWMAWIRHPEHWYRAFKLSLKFQLSSMFNNRIDLLNDVAKQCFINEKFFHKLNQILNNKLLAEESDSIIIARNQQEINDLNQLKNDLIQEGRYLNILTKEEIFNRYGFIFNGFMFAEKTHDRVLVPNFMKTLNEFIIKEGGSIINGTLEIIYKDDNQNHGIALFKNSYGEKKFIKFSNLILSLGNQEIFNKNNKRLFDVISARGVSILAHVYLPKNYKLPSALICGGTNTAIKISSQPISYDKNFDLYLMKFTAGACITPNVSNQYTAYYDGTIACGLIQSIKKTLDDQCKVEPIFVYGCNRQFSQYGQIHWFQPYKNIFVQYGAAGGGLTRSPDFITTFFKNNKFTT